MTVTKGAASGTGDDDLLAACTPRQEPERKKGKSDQNQEAARQDNVNKPWASGSSVSVWVPPAPAPSVYQSMHLRPWLGTPGRQPFTTRSKSSWRAAEGSAPRNSAQCGTACRLCADPQAVFRFDGSHIRSGVVRCTVHSRCPDRTSTTGAATLVKKHPLAGQSSTPPISPSHITTIQATPFPPTAQSPRLRVHGARASNEQAGPFRPLQHSPETSKPTDSSLMSGRSIMRNSRYWRGGRWEGGQATPTWT